MFWIVKDTNQRILWSSQQQAIMERWELHISYGVRVSMQQWHGFALPSTVIQGQHRHTRPHMLPVKRHERRRSTNIVPISLIWPNTNISNTCLRFRHDWCCIFILRGLKTPSHFSSVIKSVFYWNVLSLGRGGNSCEKIKVVNQLSRHVQIFPLTALHKLPEVW